MATISNIRKRSGLVIGVIGVAILLFLISDAFQNNSNLFSGNGEKVVGEIDGEEIPQSIFADQLEGQINSYKSRAGVSSLNAQQSMQVNDQTWNRLIIERMITQEMDALGIEVGNEEIWYIMQGKAEPDPWIKQNFSDPETKQYDPARLKSFIENINQAPPQDREAWATVESSFEQTRREDKYVKLIQTASYYTDLEAKYHYLANNQAATVKYIALKAADVEDADLSVTDEEIKAFAKGKEIYEQKDSRSIKFVQFPFNPSSKDTSTIRDRVAVLKSKFASAENDYSFARKESESKVDTTYKAPFQIAKSLQEDVVGAQKGKLIGPYFEDGQFKLTKIIDVKEGVKTYYRASEILVEVDGSTDDDTTKAYKEAKEIMAQFKSGESTWKELALKNNKAGRSNKDLNGDLGWFEEGSQLPKVNKEIAKRDSGDLFIVQTKEGAHLIQLTRKPTKKKYSIASIAKSVIASEATITGAFNQAKDFLYSANSAEAFMNQVAEKGLDLTDAENLKPMDTRVAGVGEARDLVKWAYNQNKVDAITQEVFKLNDAYAIALLTEIQVKGEVDLEANRMTITDILMAEKKVDQLYEKMKGAYTTDLDALAAAVGGTVQSTSGAKLEIPVVEGLGNEPEFIGTIFGLKEGETSQVIKGRAGVYVVQVESFTEVTMPDNFADYKAQNNLGSSQQTSAQVKVFNTLTKLANPVDNRYLYY